MASSKRPAADNAEPRNALLALRERLRRLREALDALSPAPQPLAAPATVCPLAPRPPSRGRW